MKRVRAVNRTREVVLAESCEVAANIFTRIRGLLGRPGLAAGQGLLLVPCPSIHMFGMKFPIDAVFTTRDSVVTDCVSDLAAGKYYVARSGCGKPHSALELPAGTIAASGTRVGDVLELIEQPVANASP